MQSTINYPDFLEPGLIIFLLMLLVHSTNLLQIKAQFVIFFLPQSTCYIFTFGFIFSFGYLAGNGTALVLFLSPV